jgi:hypothetical protein
MDELERKKLMDQMALEEAMKRKASEPVLPEPLDNLRSAVHADQSQELINLLQTPTQYTAADPSQDPNDMFNQLKRFKRLNELMKK